MPPKGKSNSTVITRETLIDCNERMSQSEKPSEADFKILLSAIKSNDEVKQDAAKLIPRYAEKFPAQMKTTIEAMTELSKSENSDIRAIAIKGAAKFYESNKKEITSILLERLGDEDARIVEIVEPIIERNLENDEEFRGIFLESLQSQKPESQCKMIDLIRDKIQFNEENVPQLLEIIQIAFKSCVVEGLRLYGRNKKLISEEQAQPLIDNLLELLDNSLESNFDGVVNTLLVQILKFTRTIGQASTTKLLNILSTRLMPKFDSLPIEVKIAVIQKIADVSRSVETEDLLVQIYNKIFLKFPKTSQEQVNLSLIEATLFAIYRLSQKFNKAASKLIGTVLVRTGQPGEADDVSEDETKQAEFKERLENFKTLATAFKDQCKAKYISIKEKKATTEDEIIEKKKELKTCTRAQRTGKNIFQISFALLGKNPLTSTIDNVPSWNKIKGNKFTKGGNKKNHNDRKKNFNNKKFRDNRRNNHRERNQ